MTSDFERFTQSLNESIDLIEQNPQIKSGTPSLLQSLDEVLDTPSLLARCDEICQQYEKKKPKLRIIHHLACSGGSLLSKCLAAMPNVYLLSEVHPFTDLGLSKGKPKYSPTDLIALSHYAGVPNHQDLAGELFKQAVMTTYQHVEKLGGILVLRDHTHSDYCTHAELPEKSRVHQLLEEDFEIESILTIRDPIDSYASLVKNGWVHFSPGDFDEYCRRILVMLEQFETEQIFKYEDFVDNPQGILEKICRNLDLPFGDICSDLINFDSEKLSLKCKSQDMSLTNSMIKINDSLIKYGVDFISNSKFNSFFDFKKIIDKQGYICIVVAGMRHSGSTALFNILRLGIEYSGYTLKSGYSEKIELKEFLDSKKNVLLIKTHEIRDDIKELADIIITTERDLRDTVASAQRRDFPLLKKMANVEEYAKYNRLLHESWEVFSHYNFNYERFMEQPIVEINNIFIFLGMKCDDVEKIYEKVVSLPTDQYDLTLLSPTHITDPNRENSYKDTLKDSQIESITKQHCVWLKRLGYI